MSPHSFQKVPRVASLVSVALFGAWLIAPSIVWGQAAPSKPASTKGPQVRPPKPPMPETDQMANIPYYTLRDGMNSVLTLQNVASTPTAATVTIFNMEGRPHALDPLTLDPYSVKTVNLQEDVVCPLETFDSGNIEVAFHGMSMAVTGQVTVSSVNQRVSFESREQGMMDFETTKLNGIVWLPQPDAQAYLAITNASANKATVQMTVGSKNKEIPLFSRQTRLVKINDEFDKTSPALITLQQNGLPGDIESRLASCSILNTGYSSGLPMVDPGIMRTTHLAGVHFLFGQPDPSEGFPAGTQFHSPLLLANVSDKPVTAHVSEDYSIKEKPATSTTQSNGSKPAPPKPPTYKVTNVPVGDFTIPPGTVQSTELSGPLSGVDAKTVDDAGVDVDYEGAPGAIIGQLTSLDQAGDYSFEVPIKDPKAMNQFMESINPWTLENGASSILHLKNTTNKAARALATLNYPGGTYNLGGIELQPYQTVSIDVAKLKGSSQKPDAKGNVLPADAASGQIVWWQMTPYSLIGRTVHENVKEGIASSFSCDYDCCDNYSNWYSSDTSSLNGTAGGSDGQEWVEQGWEDCYGFYGGDYPYPDSGPSSDNTGIATITLSIRAPTMDITSMSPTWTQAKRTCTPGTTSIIIIWATIRRTLASVRKFSEQMTWATRK